MLLHSDKEKFEHLNSITHEGKVLLVATAADGALWYSVKQDGFEDSYLHADPAHRTGWEKWRELPLPGRRKDEHGNWKDEKDPYDQSVIDKEKEEFAVPKGSDDLIIRSRYKTYDQSAIAPVQLVSGLGHLYIFRQSKSGTLLVDRFVLDGMTNELVRKLEVRFKRSGQKYKPLQSTQDGNPGKLAKLVSVDSLDFRDANNLPFYEPTTELSLVKNLHKGWFSVVLVPTTDHDVQRWHLFIVTGTSERQVEIISIRSSKEGLFDVRDYFVAHPRPTTVSGIVRRTIALRDKEDKELRPANGIAATKYDIQTERETEEGPQLLREATRIMLAIPTDDGNTAALSFAVATDGTLSRIDESPEGIDEPLRKTEHEIMLPLNTLDEIKTIGDSTPLQRGQITALRRNEEDDRVVVTSSASNLEKLGIGDLVKIEGTVSYDGHYDQVKEPVKDDTFGIDVKHADALGPMGEWTKLEKDETGLVFDGIITGLQRKGEVIEVTSPGHGLSAGSEVQIDATHDFNGVYQVASIDGAEFTIERKWQPGASINLKREADKRRGIQFNDAQAHIETPSIELDDPASGKPCGATYSAWVFVPEGGTTDRLLVAQADQNVQLFLSSGQVVLKANLGSEIEIVKDPDLIKTGEWVHYAAVVSSDQPANEAAKTTLLLCRNGLEVSPSKPSEGTVSRGFSLPANKLQADDKQAGDYFGWSVAISGDTAIVGAYLKDDQAGGTYVFKRQGEAWTQVQKLQPGDKGVGIWFGLSAAISGDTALVGANLEGGHAGAAYVFKRQGETWTQVQKLQADDKQASDQFGVSVAINGDTAIVGAHSKDTGGADAGAAYVFKRQGETWTQVQKLQASDTAANDQFGRAVAISGDTAIVGAYLEDTDGADAGAAYIFERQGERWTQVQKLQANDTAANDKFGWSVAISGDTAIVGAYLKDTDGADAGAAYVFKRQGERWTQVQKLQAGDKQASDYFGISVAISGDTAVVGAHGKDTGGADAGAAYVFKRQGERWTQVQKLQAGDKQASDYFGISVAISGDTAVVGAHGKDTGGADAGTAYVFGVQRMPSFRIGGDPTADAKNAGPLKIADVQIWNKARTPQEIKDSMYLTLTGQETDLAGYWRMGGIVPGEPRTVVDFSVQRSNATVYGDAFVAAKTLSRSLAMKIGDKTVPATEYINEELFAVSQRVKYIETFEFRVDQGDAEPASDLFTFAYWGKRSRGAEERIPMEAGEPTFKPATAGGGWYAASCSFIVPDGVTLVRSFGISKVTGDYWDELHVRKHRITCVSDCITEERLADKVPLKTLADDQKALTALKKLDALEKEAGKLLRKKRHLEMLLSGEDKWAALISNKENLVRTWQQRRESRKSSYHDWSAENDRASLAATLFDDDYYQGQSNSYKIGMSHNAHYFGVTSVKVPDGLKVTLRGDGRSVVLTQDDENVGWSHDFNDKAWLVDFETIKGNTDAEYILTKLASSNTALDESEKRLAEQRKQLADLKRERQARKVDLDRKLTDVTMQLEALTGKFAKPYTRVLKGVADARQRAFGMSLLAEDSRGLETKGALLGFARPASRLSALETSEGNVQLSYFDAAGRMRQTNYDATADSANSRFEEWRPDSLRSCINFNQSQGPLTLPEKNRLVLQGESTIEAWVSFPLGDPDDQGEADHPNSLRCLAGSGPMPMPGQKLQAGDKQADDRFGASVAISGDTAIVGAYLEDTGGADAGAAYVFKRQGERWSEVQKLQAGDKQGDVYFGRAVAISGDTAIVGASGEDTGGADAGAAYVFKRQGERWSEVQKLQAGDKQANDYFGWAVAISGGTAIVGAHGEDTGGADAGAAYVFKRQGERWSEVQKLQAGDKQGDVYFGRAVAISGDTAIVGASGEDTGGADAGAAYVFKRQGERWSEVQKLQAGDKQANDYFGRAVAISGGTAIVGAHGEDTGGADAGAAYVFKRQGERWSEVQKLQAGDKQANDYFGRAVAISGDTAIVGAWGEDTGGADAGAAYVFKRQGERWSQVQKLQPGDKQASDYFGVSVAISGDTAIVGAWGEDTGGVDAGAAYVFTLVDGYLVAEYDPTADTESLGIVSNGQFQSSGFDLTHVADGWHHLAAVAKDGATVFYIDGKKVSAYPLAEKPFSPDARKLVEARQRLKEARSVNDQQAITDASKTVADLEKHPEVKTQADEIAAASAMQPRKPITALGATPWAKPFGKVAELRIWSVALSDEEIEVNSKTVLSGNEPGLLAYYPMDEASGSTVRDVTGNGHNGTVKGLEWWGCAAPIGLIEHASSEVTKFDGAVSAEYSTISQDPKTGRKASMMRRCLAYPSPDGIAVLADKPIEELELVWVGNAQFAPTLLGYIEGAPPIPSENLTVKSNYNGATSVTLTSSEDVVYGWDRSLNLSGGERVETFFGIAGRTSTSAGVGAEVEQELEKHKSGTKFFQEGGYTSLSSSHISSKSAIRMSDSLALHGTQEQRAKFPDLGKRFTPKNVGYALVISALADVFITRLRRSKRMIGYQTVPVEDVPPDINTITFLINPAYTMAGSLDGMTGSRATSDRFFKHVPEMRAQYGSQYPASFFRLKEAYDLKEQIDREDKRRESYFSNFNSRLTDDASLSREASSGDVPGVIGVTREVDKKDGKALSKADKETAAKKGAQEAEETTAANASKASKIAEEKRVKIDALVADQKKRTQAQGALVVWQRKMDDILARAGKHNIVNNYVWDADGGMRTEAQSFANSASHTVGGSSNMVARLGGGGDFFAAGLSVQLTVQATMTMKQTMAKTKSHTNGFGLDVNVSGVESAGITDHDDYPLMPGEKVDRYRFMSFYLEGSTRNFNDFFDYVVDPEWLESNDEEARALRQANGKANKTWRVLHRVTYVERPALMGLGRDLRALASAPKEPSDIQKLTDRLDKSEKMLKSIIDSLGTLRSKS